MENNQTLTFGQSLFTDKFCPNGHPILVSGKCRYACKPKEKRERQKKTHGKSKSPNRWYDYV